MDRRRFLALAGGILALPRPVRAWPAVAPLRRLWLVNAHTRETFDGPFRDDIGPIAVALAELSEFLRDPPLAENASRVCGLHRAASGDAGKKPNWRKCRISIL